MTDPGRQLLDVVLAEPHRAGLFTDFDGTLAPIVDNPEAARALDGARDVLAALGRHLAVVGVVSGRPAQFLLDQIGAPRVSLWGLHGLEHVEDGRVVPSPAAAGWEGEVEQAATAAERDFAGKVGVERKGLALTLHYRRDPGGAAELGAWTERVAASSGLVVHPARMSYELRPPVPHGKGVTIERAATAAGLTTTCFFGDDTSDVDGFDALARLAADAGTRTVSVGVRSEESPPELLERADVLVDGPSGVLDLLRDLADALADALDG